MALMNITSPHAHGPRKTATLMRVLVITTLPGLFALTWFFGWGNLINVIWCSIIALAAEALVLLIRKRPVAFYLRDYSALVTGVLLGLSLPALAPWWVSLVAVAFAIIIAKHLYGGMGYNPFNPAMVGFALVLISFPVAMTTSWAAPVSLLENPMSFLDTLSTIFGFGSQAIDAFTMATPLDIYKHEIGHSLAQDVTQNPVFGAHVALGWEWVNLAFLAGGLFLLRKKVFTWHTPVSMLASLAIMSLAFGWDADQATPPLLHLFAGATMLGAFYIATDPVTSAVSPQGKLIYGAGIGILTYVIRTYGSYPDAIAFSVLLMNFAAPLIDTYTQPRTYGYTKAKRGAKVAE
jgi:electron transport complex protein RnfD